MFKPNCHTWRPYVGHGSPTSTHYYLQLTPPLSQANRATMAIGWSSSAMAARLGEGLEVWFSADLRGDYRFVV